MLTVRVGRKTRPTAEGLRQRTLADPCRRNQARALRIQARAETVAAHHPCKTIHNDEVGAFDALLGAAGVTGKTAGKSPEVPSCCGGGGGGFLWDSPAKVNKNRFEQIMADTKLKKIATGCPGCHRMLAVAKDEETVLADVATILHERLQAPASPAK